MIEICNELQYNQVPYTTPQDTSLNDLQLTKTDSVELSDEELRDVRDLSEKIDPNYPNLKVEYGTAAQEDANSIFQFVAGQFFEKNVSPPLYRRELVIKLKTEIHNLKNSVKQVRSKKWFRGKKNIGQLTVADNAEKTEAMLSVIRNIQTRLMADAAIVGAGRDRLRDTIKKLKMYELAAEYAKERFQDEDKISTLNFLVQKMVSAQERANSGIKSCEDLLDKLTDLASICVNITADYDRDLKISYAVGEHYQQQALREFTDAVNDLYSGLCNLSISRF